MTEIEREVPDERASEALTPAEELDAIEVRAPKRTAGGAPSALSGLGRAYKDMGTRRALRTLTSVNQKDGFDCQSCAWPDAEGERGVAAFCENGAKAVAWEATKRRATPELFARHS